MTIYAKIRLQNSLDNTGKRVNSYVVETRDIDTFKQITSNLVDKQFTTHEEALAYINGQHFVYTTGWLKAEREAGVYRDAANNMYRSGAKGAGYIDVMGGKEAPKLNPAGIELL
jgi:hypothetical protein